MRIAIPTSQGKLEAHFGHCEEFSIFDTDDGESAAATFQIVNTPKHEPGRLAERLKEHGVEFVIAGNMCGGTQAMLQHHSIGMLTGAPALSPELLVRSYLLGELVPVPCTCDHSHAQGGCDCA